MSCIAIWVDQTNADLFHLDRDPAKKTSLQASHVDHHIHRLDQFDQNRRDKQLYQQIVEHVSSTEKILILGPGVAKYRFQNYLTEHYPSLAKKVIGCETVDYLTDPQIAALAKILSM